MLPIATFNIHLGSFNTAVTTRLVTIMWEFDSRCYSGIILGIIVNKQEQWKNTLNIYCTCLSNTMETK